MKKVIVCGGRDYLDYLAVQREMENYVYDLWHDQPMFEEEHVTFISGGASGADFLAKCVWFCNWKSHPDISFKEYPADWKKYGKAAGAIRNQQMLDEEGPIDLVIAFPGGNGTADMIRRAKTAGVKVYEV